MFTTLPHFQQPYFPHLRISPKDLMWPQCQGTVLAVKENYSSDSKEDKLEELTQNKVRKKDACLQRKSFHRTSEKSSEKIFHLLQGQNKHFLSLLIFVGYNST